VRGGKGHGGREQRDGSATCVRREDVEDGVREGPRVVERPLAERAAKDKREVDSKHEVGEEEHGAGNARGVRSCRLVSCLRRRCAVECKHNDGAEGRQRGVARDWVLLLLPPLSSAVADKVAEENRQVTDVDAESKRDADADVVVEAERNAKSDHDAVDVAPVAAAVGVASVSRATKRTAPLPLSATRTPHERSVALQCHLAPYAPLNVAVSAGPSTRPPASDPATL
jgi:hypothetical protein